LQHRNGGLKLPDFIKQTAVTVNDPPIKIDVDVAALEKLARDLSAVFRASPEFFPSGANITVQNQYVRYLDSEGTWFTRAEPLVTVDVRAYTRATDGTPIDHSFQVFGRSLDVLRAGELLERTRGLAAQLKALRLAATLDRYNGPVLFEAQAGAEVLAQVFAPAVVATRFPVTDEPQFEAGFQQIVAQFGGASLEDKIGGRVMPDTFDLTDNASLDSYSGSKLLGSCRIDDEGVTTREVKLVEHGILKNLLTTRTPTQRSTASTASRHALGATPSNMFLTSTKTASDSELRQQLLRLAKARGYDFGIVVRRVGVGGLSWAARFAGQMGAPGQVIGSHEIYKVYEDGREELVRNAEFAPLAAAAFKEIIAVGDKPAVVTTPFIPGAASAIVNAGSMRGDPSLATFVAPALLFEEVSIKNTEGPVPNAPVAPSPLAQARP
jgi:TldD protein